MKLRFKLHIWAKNTTFSRLNSCGGIIALHAHHSHLVLKYDVPVWLSAHPLIHIHIHKTSYPTRRRACSGCVEWQQIKPKSAELDLWKNANESGVTKSVINPNSVSSAGKRPGSQILGPCRAGGSRFRVFSKYPQDIISRLSFVSVYNCRES